MSQKPPPPTRKTDVTETIHGTAVPDPYRWLEDDASPEVAQWIADQNTFTRAYLDAIPVRDDLKKRFTELLYTTTFSVPVPKKGKYFFTERKESEDLSVLYVQEGLNGSPRALIDPNLFPKEKRANLKSWSTSRDGKLLAYGLSEAGNDQMSIFVMNVETGEKFTDVIPAEAYPDTPSAWEPDGTGFWYTRRMAVVPKGEEKFHKRAYYHRFGDDWRNDELVFGDEIKKEDYPSVRISEDGRHLLMFVGISSEEKRRTELFVRERSAEARQLVPLVKNLDGIFVASFHKDFIYALTDFHAPSWKIVRISIADALRGVREWSDVIPEQKGSVVESFRAIGDCLFVERNEKMVLRLSRHTLNGTLLSEIPLPAIGSITAHRGEPDGNEFLFGFTSFLTPHAIFRFDLTTNTLQKIREAPGGIDPDGCTVQQAWYSSKDGTQIPMFVVHRKDLAGNEDNPLYLYGYGGFGHRSMPAFSKSIIDFVRRGGIYAVANIRGGGELGQE